MKTGRVDRLIDRLVVPGFSRLGYMIRGIEQDHSRVDGRTMVVTGATAGLGEWTARRLAELGATVVAVGRSLQKLERLQQASSGRLTTEVADLSSMSEVSDLAARILDSHPEIHVLINNVGSMFDSRMETAEGLELTFATNLAGQFLLTERLIPRLIASPPARIITVSSGGMYTTPLSVAHLQSPSDFRPALAYARTKRAQVVLAEMWADQLEGTDVVSHSVHPGWVDTPGVAGSMPRFRSITRPLLRTVEQGGDTIVWLATDDEPARTSGLFWHDRRPRPTHRLDSTIERPGSRDLLRSYLTRTVEAALSEGDRT